MEYAYISGSVAHKCDFETSVVGSLPCGFIQSVTDDADWLVGSGSTATSDTGPSGDHTTGAGKHPLASSISYLTTVTLHLDDFIYFSVLHHRQIPVFRSNWSGRRC